jgi:hypothetical protein
MPFLIPVAIAAGSAFAGSKLAGGKGGSSSGGSSSAIDPNLARLLGMKENQAGFTFDIAKDILPKATETMQGPLDYWTKLLSGDSKAIQEAIAPEAGRIVSQYDSARKAATQLSPRSGARTETLTDLPFRAISDVSKVAAGVRPRAAEEVSKIGGTQAALATSLLFSVSAGRTSRSRTRTRPCGATLAAASVRCSR